MLSTNNSNNVAIFIDYDNIYVSLERYYETRSDRDLKTKIVKAIKDLYADKTIYVFKAFADFQKISPVLTDLQKLQVQLRHVFSQNGETQHRKNASDIALTIDVMKTLFSREHIGTFVLASSDSDMLSLIEELKYNGKNVELIYVDYCAMDNIGDYVTQSYTVEYLIGKPKYVELIDDNIKANLQQYLEVINNTMHEIKALHKGKGTCSRKDINKGLAKGLDIVQNDISLVIKYLDREEILIDTGIPNSKYTKVMINPDWFASSGITLSKPILKEEDYR